MSTVYASYNRIDKANQAIDLLMEKGISKDQISVVTLEENRSSVNSNVDATTTIGEDTTSGIAGGATAGGVLGLIAGIAALAIPGFGPLLVAGPLAASLGAIGVAGAVTTAVGSVAGTAATGAVAGGAVGGVTGLITGLVHAGVNEADAHSMESVVKNGGVLVAVSDYNADHDEEITTTLNTAHPDSVVTVM